MVLLDISPLRIRNFRFLYLSQFISLLGSQMTVVTIPFQIFGLTNSTFQTGLVSAIELVCLVATALLGGVIADKFDRRKIIVRSELIMMCLVVLLMVNSLLPEPSLWLIYVLAGIISGVNGFHRPAFEALTPTIVAKHDLPKVSSLMSLKICISLTCWSYSCWLFGGEHRLAVDLFDRCFVFHDLNRASFSSRFRKKRPYCGRAENRLGLSRNHRRCSLCL